MSDIRATVSRLHADDFGESRFETVTVPLSEKAFAPQRLHFIAQMRSPPNTTSFLSFLSIGVGPSHTRLQVDTYFFAWLADFA
jgi:hypothetical protein